MSSKVETSDLYAMFKGSEQFKLMQIDDFVEKVSNAEKQGGNLGFITIKSLAVYFKEWTDLTQTYSTLYKFINSVLFKDVPKHLTGQIETESLLLYGLL